MTENLCKVIAVVGATASGKTSYAIDLAKKCNGEIVSADSRLVYKDFNIATAKPTLEERQGIPHYMIDIVEPDFDYSVGHYVKDAKKCIEGIISRNKTPIVVGGTGLYLNALLMNYNLPDVKPNYELRKQLECSENLYERLCSLDSDLAKKIEPNDRKKIIRYLEVIITTGKSISNSKNEIEYDVEWIGLNFPREELYARINERVDIMVKDGLVDETKALLDKYGRIGNLINTIGYQEIISYLDGELNLDQALDMLKQNTRRYAKRQLTWFRKNQNINWNLYPDVLKK